jgi:hypothetical protein
MVTADYHIDLHGELGPDLWDAFAPWEVSVGEGRTSIHARRIDQAALHGILSVVQSFGLELLVVERIEEPPSS